MAQTIGVVDPWSGLTKGVETLRQAATAADERKLNELKMQMTKQQMEENALKLQAAKQAWQDQEARRSLAQQLASERKTVTTPGYGGLSDVQAYENAVRQNQQGAPAMWSDTATAPVPAGGQGINLPTLSGQTAAPTPTGLGLSNAPNGPYETFNRNMAEKPVSQEQLDMLNEKAIAAQQASGLKTYGQTTEQRPLSNLEKAQRMADLQFQQGDAAGSLATVKAGIDITTQIPEATQKVTSDLMRQGYNLIAAGKSTEEAKAAIINYAKQTYPAELINGIDQIQFTPNGVGVINVPGGIITTTYDPKTGGTTFQYHGAKDPFSGGLDAIDLRARAEDLIKQNPGMTKAEALGQAAKAVRADINAAKQNLIQVRVNAQQAAGSDRKSIQGETGLRKEFNALQEVKNYKTFSTQFATMSSVMDKIKDFKSLNPADQALIMEFNKALDPASVVRESEYLRTPASMSILNKASAAASRLMQGGVLNATERQALMQAATLMKNASKSQYDAVRAQYQDLAKQYGYDPKNVVPTLAQTGDAPPTGKTVVRTGTTKDGRKVIQYSDGSLVTQ